MHYPQVEIVETVDGKYMILVNGFQWGYGSPDASGAYSTVFESWWDAFKAWAERSPALVS